MTEREHELGKAHAAFWARTDRRGVDECWPWTGSVDRAGYGCAHASGWVAEGKAHRLSWEIHNGPIPAGLFVLHSCDNPPCVNPAHLRVGTHAENMRDMVRRGRSTAKLTPDDRLAIMASSESRSVLAARYGVSTSAITAARAPVRALRRQGRSSW